MLKKMLLIACLSVSGALGWVVGGRACCDTHNQGSELLGTNCFLDYGDCPDWEHRYCAAWICGSPNAVWEDCVGDCDIVKLFNPCFN
jgi:hypothetical protein